MRNALIGSVLLLAAVALIGWFLLNGGGFGGNTSVAQDAPEEPAKDPEPEPAKPEAGYGEYKIPFERGEGSAKFTRQNEMLRLDVEVRLPYSGGDGQRSRGSCLDLVLSVDGLNGRHLFYYPNPIWVPDGRGNFPPNRIEMSWDNDKDEPMRLQGEPSFVGTADVKHWAKWTATMWIDLRYVLIPGNTPTSIAETWHAGLIMGNEAGTLIYPSGLDAQNPGKTPKAMFSFELSKLPEMEEADENPRDELLEAEKAMQKEMKGIEAKLTVGDYAGSMKTLEARIEKHPTELWAHYLAYVISQASTQRRMEGVDSDFAKYQRAYVEACPGQSSAHLDYMGTLLGDAEFEKANAYAKTVFESAMCTERPETNGYMRLKWAERCISWGNADAAETQFNYIAEHEELLKDDAFRIDFGIQRAALAARKGDSKGAVDIYTKLIEAEAKNFKLQQFNAVQQLLQFQRQAAEQWEDELKYREADAAKTNPRVVIETDKGKVVIELFEDDAPNTVASIVSLAKKEFYDGLTFHRFVPDFMVQGGDPNGNGTGGPGYRLKGEISKRNHFRGSVAMARTNDPDSQGSQFYICVGNSVDVINLSGKYVVVGRVIEGMDVVDQLRVGSVMKTVRAENLRDHEYVPETIK